jgi:hypothetical protein
MGPSCGYSGKKWPDKRKLNPLSFDPTQKRVSFNLLKAIKVFYGFSTINGVLVGGEKRIISNYYLGK